MEPWVKICLFNCGYNDFPQPVGRANESLKYILFIYCSGQLLASGSSDNTVRLWNTATGGLQKTLKGHSGSVLSVTFSPEDRLLATGSDDNTVRLWDTATGDLQETLSTVGRATELEFSQDGSHLNTNLGSLHVQSMCYSRTSCAPKKNSGLSLICLKGQRRRYQGAKEGSAPRLSKRVCFAI